MTAALLPNAKQQFEDIDGNPLVGGTVEFYVANTLVPKDTWQDATQLILNTNPVVLDARGQALIYGVGIYRQILRDSSGNLIWDQPTASPGGGNGGFGAQVSIASATTTDLGSLNSNNVLVTGTTTITSFGTSATLDSPIYLIEFSSALTLTNNNTSMMLPNGIDLKTHAGDFALFMVTDAAAGYWTIIEYFRKNGQPISVTGPRAAIASSTTTDIGSTGANLVTIVGTTTITSLGSSATTGNPLYFVTFTNSLTLTYNATSLILPSAINIQTLAGDFAIFQYLGSGNWQCLSYSTPLDSSGALIKVDTYATAGTYTWTKDSSCNSIIVDVIGGGGSGAGAGTSTNLHIMVGGGGGAGAYTRGQITSVLASYTVTVGAGGAAPTAGANDGNNGAASSFGTALVANGGGKGFHSSDVARPGQASGPSGSGGTVGTAGNILSVAGAVAGYGVGIIYDTIGFVLGGTGGAGPFGGAPGASLTSAAGSNVGGNAATGPGSGGSGGTSWSGGSAANTAGGAGHDGLVVVYSYT